tara:strand:+ start:26625 stop:26843 length:219 start_codon:yes stop_codon:yes gene_type:complete
MSKITISKQIRISDAPTKKILIFWMECHGFTVISKFLPFLVNRYNELEILNKQKDNEIRNLKLQLKMSTKSR